MHKTSTSSSYQTTRVIFLSHPNNATGIQLSSALDSISETKTPNSLVFCLTDFADREANLILFSFKIWYCDGFTQYDYNYYPLGLMLPITIIL